VTRLTQGLIDYAVREAKKGMGGRPHETPGQMAARWGVTPRRVRQVQQQWRETGDVPQQNPNRRPKGPPLLWDQVAAIVQEHKEHPVGATELWHRLKAKGVSIPHDKIHRLYRERKWTTPNKNKQKPRSRGRYNREHAGSLLHADYHRTNENSPHVILWIDDASRRVLSGGEFPEETGEHAIETFDAALEEAARWGLIVRQAKTDRGSQFYANEQKGKDIGYSKFEIHLAQLGIDFVPNKPHSPESNGKSERLWYEYDKHRGRFANLQGYIDWTNDRPHSHHQYATPNQAWTRKLPVETLVGLHHRLVENDQKPVTVELLYGK
jgi:transposase